MRTEHRGFLKSPAGKYSEVCYQIKRKLDQLKKSPAGREKKASDSGL